jgi:hypothetical protein
LTTWCSVAAGGGQSEVWQQPASGMQEAELSQNFCSAGQAHTLLTQVALVSTQSESASQPVTAWRSAPTGTRCSHADNKQINKNERSCTGSIVSRCEKRNLAESFSAAGDFSHQKEPQNEEERRYF